MKHSYLSMSRREKGIYAEKLASYLYKTKYKHKILYRNLRCKAGEIDLITDFEGELFLIEIKGVMSNSFGEAIIKWTKSQKKRFRSTIKYLIVQGVIPDLEKIHIEFIVFDFSGRTKVRFKRYTNISLRI